TRRRTLPVGGGDLLELPGRVVLGQRHGVRPQLLDRVDVGALDLRQRGVIAVVGDVDSRDRRGRRGQESVAALRPPHGGVVDPDLAGQRIDVASRLLAVGQRHGARVAQLVVAKLRQRVHTGRADRTPCNRLSRRGVDGRGGKTLGVDRLDGGGSVAGALVRPPTRTPVGGTAFATVGNGLAHEYYLSTVFSLSLTLHGEMPPVHCCP